MPVYYAEEISTDRGTIKFFWQELHLSLLKVLPFRRKIESMIESLDLCLKLGKGYAEVRTFSGIVLKSLHTAYAPP